MYEFATWLLVPQSSLSDDIIIQLSSLRVLVSATPHHSMEKNIVTPYHMTEDPGDRVVSDGTSINSNSLPDNTTKINIGSIETHPAISMGVHSQTSKSNNFF
jgi:hypothetical protein